MECLLFDFGGTLDSDGLTWLDRFRRIYKEAGLEIPEKQLDRAFYDADDALPARHALRGLSLEQTVRLQVADVLRAAAPEHAAALTPVVAGRFVDDCLSHLRRNRPILQKLASRWKLGIVSNWYGNLEGVLRAEGMLDLFGAVADSGVVGAIKPEPGIFLAALDRLGGTPQTSVMIGDSIKRDMRGAEGLGMRHVLLTQSMAPCCAKGKMIGSLLDLEDALAEALA